jgi:hypothetical protein
MSEQRRRRRYIYEDEEDEEDEETKMTTPRPSSAGKASTARNSGMSRSAALQEKGSGRQAALPFHASLPNKESRTSNLSSTSATLAKRPAKLKPKFQNSPSSAGKASTARNSGMSRSAASQEKGSGRQAALPFHASLPNKESRTSNLSSSSATLAKRPAKLKPMFQNKKKKKDDGDHFKIIGTSGLSLASSSAKSDTVLPLKKRISFRRNEPNKEELTLPHAASKSVHSQEKCRGEEDKRKVVYREGNLFSWGSCLKKQKFQMGQKERNSAMNPPAALQETGSLTQVARPSLDRLLDEKLLDISSAMPAKRPLKKKFFVSGNEKKMEDKLYKHIAGEDENPRNEPNEKETLPHAASKSVADERKLVNLKCFSLKKRSLVGIRQPSSSSSSSSPWRQLLRKKMERKVVTPLRSSAREACTTRNSAMNPHPRATSQENGSSTQVARRPSLDSSARNSAMNPPADEIPINEPIGDFVDRVWTDVDTEIRFLNSIIDYHKIKGEYPFHNLEALDDFTENWLRADVPEYEQLIHVVRKLRRKYLSTMARRGPTGYFADTRVQTAFDLAFILWGDRSDKRYWLSLPYTAPQRDDASGTTSSRRRIYSDDEGNYETPLPSSAGRASTARNSAMMGPPAASQKKDSGREAARPFHARLPDKEAHTSNLPPPSPTPVKRPLVFKLKLKNLNNKKKMEDKVDGRSGEGAENHNLIIDKSSSSLTQVACPSLPKLHDEEAKADISSATPAKRPPKIMRYCGGEDENPRNYEQNESFTQRVLRDVYTEIGLLNAIIDYYATNGMYPFHDHIPLHYFITDWLQVNIPEEKLIVLVKMLRKKYLSNMTRKGATTVDFADSRDQIAFNLAHKIWGGGSNEEYWKGLKLKVKRS